MKRFFQGALAALMLLATACQRHTVIPDDELALIFHDAYLTNAYIDTQHPATDSLNLYAPIFAHYGYTTEDVQYTIGNFSKRKSARLSDVVEAAIDLLEEEGKRYDREVEILDTIKQVALRRAKRMLLCDSTLRVRSLRDTARTWLEVPIEGLGEYRITIDYEVDSLDQNKRLQRCTWIEQKGGNRTQLQYYSLRRNMRDTYTRRITLTDTTAQTLHVRLLHFPEKPKRTSVTFHKVTVEYTPTEAVATDQLYREELGLRIFADHFLRAAREKDSL